MTNIRRLPGTFVQFVMGAMLMAGSAFATPITVTISVYGDIPSFTLETGPHATSASQFNATAINAAIAAACAAGHTCSALTLNQIDFTLHATNDVTVGVVNSAPSTKYIASIIGSEGTYLGGATSGTALLAEEQVTASDSITTDLVIANPTLSVATDTRRVNPKCASGSATALNFQNCLAVAPGGKTFTGTASDSGSASYLSSDANWATVLSTYVGSGTVGFTLDSSTSTSNGTLYGASGVSNSATEHFIANGLQVAYTYTYDDTTTSVPEPTAMALMGAALVGIGLIRRRRTTR